MTHRIIIERVAIWIITLSIFSCRTISERNNCNNFQTKIETESNKAISERSEEISVYDSVFFKHTIGEKDTITIIKTKYKIIDKSRAETIQVVKTDTFTIVHEKLVEKTKEVGKNWKIAFFSLVFVVILSIFLTKIRK